MTKEAKVWALYAISDPKGMSCQSCLPPSVEEKKEHMWVCPPIVIINPSQLYFKRLGVSTEHDMNMYTSVLYHVRRENTHHYRL